MFSSLEFWALWAQIRQCLIPLGPWSTFNTPYISSHRWSRPLPPSSGGASHTSPPFSSASCPQPLPFSPLPSSPPPLIISECNRKTWSLNSQLIHEFFYKIISEQSTLVVFIFSKSLNSPTNFLHISPANFFPLPFKRLSWPDQILNSQWVRRSRSWSISSALLQCKDLLNLKHNLC